MGGRHKGAGFQGFDLTCGPSTLELMKRELRKYHWEMEPAYLGREDVKMFIAWGFLNKLEVEKVDDDELEGYLSHLEKTHGVCFGLGETCLQPCRVSTDVMNLRHKSLTFYIVSSAVVHAR